MLAVTPDLPVVLRDVGKFVHPSEPQSPYVSWGNNQHVSPEVPSWVQ